MHQVFVSFTPINLFILLGEDPNFRPGIFLKLNGVEEHVSRFTLEVLNDKLETIFQKEYLNLEVARHSLLEFYTGLKTQGSMVRLKLDAFEKIVDLKEAG